MWSTELNDAIQLDIVIAALFEDKSTELPHGNIWHLPARHNLAANALASGTPATPEAITESEQTYTVSTQNIVAQQLESIAEIQSRYDLRKEFTDAAAYAMARVMDVDCAALLDDNTTQTVGTLGSELSLDNLLTARKYLRNSAAKGPFKAVVAPATYNGFLKVEQFTNSLYNGDGSGSAIEMAKLGTVFNMDFYESQLTTGTSPSSSGCVWAAGHFFKIVQKRPKVDTTYEPLSKTWVAAMDQIYGVFERQEADEAASATSTARLWCVRLQGVK